MRIVNEALTERPSEAPLNAQAHGFDDSDILSRRVGAFFIDVIVLLMLSALATIGVFVLGIITFGFGFILFAILYPALVLIYAGATIGGPHSATIGMRMAGIALKRMDGSRPDAILGAAHMFLFYVSVSLLTPFVLLFALMTPNKRFLHDIVLDVRVIRAR